MYEDVAPKATREGRQCCQHDAFAQVCQAPFSHSERNLTVDGSADALIKPQGVAFYECLPT